MIFGDSVAGRAAVEALVEDGRLVSDFWLRAHIQHQAHSAWDDQDTCRDEVSTAIKVAMGKADEQLLPDWAHPSRQSPDFVMINPAFRKEIPTAEPYYSVNALSKALESCYTGPELNHDETRRQVNHYRNFSRQAWRRIIPHFSAQVSADILAIENDTRDTRRSRSMRADINSHVDKAMIRDAPFFEFYDRQGADGLKKVFHGLGQKAVLGVGAMLFLSGEHDELMPAAEALEEVLGLEYTSDK